MKRILDVYFCWRDLVIDDVVKVSSLHIEMVRVLLQLHCNLIAVCFVHLPPSFTFLFVLVQRLAVSLSSTKWLPSRIVVAVHRFYGQVKVAQTLKLPTQTATCSTFVEMPLNMPAPFHHLMYVCSPNWSASTAVPPSVCRHVHPSLDRSLPPLAGFQCSSDTRSCSGRSSCARTQRSRHHRLEADLLE